MIDQVRVFAPATVSNVACGFDIFGFAMETPGDEVVLKLVEEPGVRITKIDGDNGKLPWDISQNTAGVAVSKFLHHIQSNPGIEIELYKKMPLSSGLGSSAASSVAAVFAANQLLGQPLQREELLPYALAGEKIACGTAHADNAAPALLGGFILIRSYAPLDVVRIPTPANLFCSIFHPQLEIRTADARRILKNQIPLQDAITQWGNVAGLITGLMKPDLELIRRSMQDVVVEPVRSALIPGYRKVKEAAMKAGALGCSISGSGPSIFAFCSSEQVARKAGEAMKKEFSSIDIDGEIYFSPINQKGPKIIDYSEL